MESKLTDLIAFALHLIGDQRVQVGPWPRSENSSLVSGYFRSWVDANACGFCFLIILTCANFHQHSRHVQVSLALISSTNVCPFFNPESCAMHSAWPECVAWSPTLKALSVPEFSSECESVWKLVPHHPHILQLPPPFPHVQVFLALSNVASPFLVPTVDWPRTCIPCSFKCSVTIARPKPVCPLFKLTLGSRPTHSAWFRCVRSGPLLSVLESLNQRTVGTLDAPRQWGWKSPWSSHCSARSARSSEVAPEVYVSRLEEGVSTKWSVWYAKEWIVGSSA